MAIASKDYCSRGLQLRKIFQKDISKKYSSYKVRNIWQIDAQDASVYATPARLPSVPSSSNPKDTHRYFHKLRKILC
jgi:hypothetical protein